MFIKNYHIGGRLFADAVGSIHLASTADLDQAVCVKLLHPELTGDAEIVQAFHQCAEYSCALRDDALVNTLSHGEDSGFHYLVLENVGFEQLARRLHQSRALPFFEAVDVIQKVAHFLRTVHIEGLLHGCLTPYDVFVSKDQQEIKLANFAFADLLKLLLRKEAKTAQAVLPYLAPEFVSSPGQVGRHTDVYSLGVIFYQALTGALPWSLEELTGESGQNLPSVVPPSLRRLEIPDLLDSLVLSAIDPEIDKRCPNFSRFISELSEARDSILATLTPTTEMFYDILGTVQPGAKDPINGGAAPSPTTGKEVAEEHESDHQLRPGEITQSNGAQSFNGTGEKTADTEEARKAPVAAQKESPEPVTELPPAELSSPPTETAGGSAGEPEQQGETAAAVNLAPDTTIGEIENGTPRPATEEPASPEPLPSPFDISDLAAQDEQQPGPPPKMPEAVSTPETLPQSQAPESTVSEESKSETPESEKVEQVTSGEDVVVGDFVLQADKPLVQKEETLSAPRTQKGQGETSSPAAQDATKTPSPYYRLRAPEPPEEKSDDYEPPTLTQTEDLVSTQTLTVERTQGPAQPVLFTVRLLLAALLPILSVYLLVAFAFDVDFKNRLSRLRQTPVVQKLRSVVNRSSSGQAPRKPTPSQKPASGQMTAPVSSNPVPTGSATSRNRAAERNPTTSTTNRRPDAAATRSPISRPRTTPALRTPVRTRSQNAGRSTRPKRTGTPVASRSGQFSLQISVRSAGAPLVADVFLDGRRYGQTNSSGLLLLRSLKVGRSYIVKVQKPGFEMWAQEVSSSRTGLQALAVNLKPAKSSTRDREPRSRVPGSASRVAFRQQTRPTINAPAPRQSEEYATVNVNLSNAERLSDVYIYVNGRLWQGENNFAPGRLKLPAGSYEIAVRKEGYQAAPPSYSLTLLNGETKTINFLLLRR